MRSILMLSCLTLLLSSCGRKKCDISDLSKVQWKQVDSTLSYFACNTSGDTLLPGDKVTINFAGTVNNRGEVVMSITDSLTYSTATGLLSGTYQFSDINDENGFRPLIAKMGKHAEYYIKYQMQPPRGDDQPGRIYVYFNSTTDSAQAIKWLNTMPYIRSITYTSKQDAMRKMLQTDSSGTIDMGLIDDNQNPLPNTATIIIDPVYMNKPQLDSIRQVLFKNSMVSDVHIPNPDVPNMINQYKELLKVAYVFKIKT